MKQKIYAGVYFLSLFFIASGAFNYGFSRFWPAVPFVFLAVFIARNRWRSKRKAVLVLALFAASVAVNATLEKNPLMFPVLREGEIVVTKDGYLRTFLSDGSGGFVLSASEDGACLGCGEIQYRRLEKGQKIKVTGVRLEHPDFSTRVTIVTDIGNFSEESYKNRSVLPNKPVESVLGARLGDLMYYPLVPLFLIRGV